MTIDTQHLPMSSATYAGMHLLVEMWGIDRAWLSAEHFISRALILGAQDSGATILHTHFHHFGVESGVTGVVLLQESHISIHTWPEIEYAALDLFMCGTCNPHRAMHTITELFKPTRVLTSEVLRGIVR